MAAATRTLACAAALAAWLPGAAPTASPGESDAAAAPRIREIRGGEVGELLGYELAGPDGEVVRTLDIRPPHDDGFGHWAGETRFEAGGLHVAMTEIRTLVLPRPGAGLPLGARRNTVSLHRATGEWLFELRNVPWLAAAVAAESGDVALLSRVERGLPAAPDELRIVASDGETVRLELREEPRTLWNVHLSPRGEWLAYTLREPNGGPPLAVRIRHLPSGQRFELPARNDLALAAFSEIDDGGALAAMEDVSESQPDGTWTTASLRRVLGRAEPGGEASVTPREEPGVVKAVAQGGRVEASPAAWLAHPPAIEFRREDGTLAERIERSGATRREGERIGGDGIELLGSPSAVLVMRTSSSAPEPATWWLERIAVDVANTVSLYDPAGRVLFEQDGVRYECVALAESGEAIACGETLPEEGCIDPGWRPGMQPDHDTLVVLGRDGSVETRLEEPPFALTSRWILLSPSGRWLAYRRAAQAGERMVVLDRVGGTRHEIPVAVGDPRRTPDRISDDGDLLDVRGDPGSAGEPALAVIWQRPR